LNDKLALNIYVLTLSILFSGLFINDDTTL
jgi:hypothetical protein